MIIGIPSGSCDELPILDASENVGLCNFQCNMDIGELMLSV